MLKYIKYILVLLVILTGSIGTVYSKTKLREITNKELSDKSPLYLPKAEFVKLTTFGFERFASDILWFRTINYFGKQMSKQETIPWFAHMCDLVTELNPKASTHYEFCSSLLSWIAKDAKSSIKLLNRAISYEPDYWRYYYLRGFNYWYFLENNKKAKTDFMHGAKLPGAPAFLSSLAGRLVASENNPAHAINFLSNLIEQTKDEHAKKALENNLKLAIVSRDLELLNQLIVKYKEDIGENPMSMEQLLEHKLITYIPKDPFGDAYYLNETSQPLSVKGKKGLTFHGKTAKTGLASFEK